MPATPELAPSTSSPPEPSSGQLRPGWLATKLEDTENARLPVFSPDGRWIAYFANSKLWRIAVTGGAPVENRMPHE